MTKLWNSRNFVLSAVRQEFAVRFSRSKIGAMWMVIYPLAQVTVFALVLSKVLGSRLPDMSSPYSYAIYLMAGQLAWTGFSETLLRTMNAFISNAGLIKKTNFPLAALPMIDFLIGLINTAIFFLVIVVIFAVLDHLPGKSVLLVPLLILLNLFLGIAIGIVCGVLNVFVRDVGQLVPIILNFGFWLTPVVYVPNVLPDSIRSIVEWNPMYHVVGAFHDALVFDKMVDASSLAAVAVFAMVVMMLGLFMLRRGGEEMADVL